MVSGIQAGYQRRQLAGIGARVLDELHPPANAIDFLTQRLIVGSTHPQYVSSPTREQHVTETFDLERGPLVRAELVRLASDHHVLVLTSHHIVMDGWSFWVVVRDLAALYALDTGARKTPLLPAPSFADFATEQAARAESDAVGRTGATIPWRQAETLKDSNEKK